MNEETSVAHLQIPESQSLSVQEVVAQVAKIQQIMTAVMKESTKEADGHYGIIPGTKKHTLFKSGAEKLALTFRMASTYSGDDSPVNYPDGHREYEIKCSLASIHDGRFLGEGVGVCSTKESKWRYRSESTGKEVPGKYWDKRDPELLGGPQFSAKKVGGKWVICHRVEHTDTADYYNTCKKMAKKRAFVDAVISCLAASDIFTQDVEDLPQDAPDDPPKVKPSATKKATSKPRNVQAPPPAQSDKQPQEQPQEQPPDDTQAQDPTVITRHQEDEIKEALFEGLQHYGNNEEGRKADRKQRIKRMADKLEVYGYEKIKELRVEAFDEFIRFAVDIAKPTLVTEEQPQANVEAEEL